MKYDCSKWNKSVTKAIQAAKVIEELENSSEVFKLTQHVYHCYNREVTKLKTI